jgi:hypothetical protein
MQVASAEVTRESVGVVVADLKEGRTRSLVVDVLVNNNTQNILQRLTIKSIYMFHLKNVSRII